MLPSIARVPVFERDSIHLMLKSKDGRPVRAGDPDFADALQETIERLENEDGGGWKSVGVRIEADSKGYCQLTVRMKRPKSVVSGQIRHRATAKRRAA